MCHRNASGTVSGERPAGPQRAKVRRVANGPTDGGGARHLQHSIGTMLQFAGAGRPLSEWVLQQLHRGHVQRVVGGSGECASGELVGGKGVQGCRLENVATV